MRSPVIFILSAAVILSSCASESAPVIIGFLGPLTGKLADLGISGRNGALLAVEAFNSGSGKPFTAELVSADDSHDPETARRALAELKSKKAAGIVGPMTSDIAHAVLSLADTEKLVLVSPTASSPKLGGLDDFFLRVNPPDSTEGEALAAYLAGKGGVRTVVITHDSSNTSFSVPLAETFSSALKKGVPSVRIVVAKYDLHKDPASKLFLSELAAAKADVLFMIANALDAGILVQQAKRTVPNITVLGTGWSMTPEYISQGGAAADGTVFSHYHNVSSRAPAWLAFKNSYTERFGKPPDFVAALGYNAAKVFLDALAKDQNRERLKKTILEMKTFEGLQGKIEFDASGDCLLERRILVVRNGTLQETGF